MNLVMTLKDTYIQFRIREDVKNSLQKVDCRHLRTLRFKDALKVCEES